MTPEAGDWYVADGINFKIVRKVIFGQSLWAEAQVTPVFYRSLEELEKSGAVCIYQASDENTWPRGDT